MATITEKTKDSFSVQIRKKGVFLTETFSSKEDAELWAKYKEDLINQISAFDPHLQEMITLQDAIELKIQDSIEKGKKDIGDFKILPEVFSKFCSRQIYKITFEELLSYFDELMQTPVRQGGSKKDKTTGVLKLPSIYTTFRKFGYLSTVFQLLKEQGVNVDNPALKVVQFIRPRLKQKKTNEYNKR